VPSEPNELFHSVVCSSAQGATVSRPCSKTKAPALHFCKDRASPRIGTRPGDRGSSRPFGPGIAGIELHRPDIAAAAVDLLDLQLRQGAYGIPERRKTLYIDSDWRDGASLPRVT